jgi:polyhydroxyalkanoate synthesis repressor PhaR
MDGSRGGEVTIKKYSNRRLYDTSDSRYITLDELAQKIRAGHDVSVVDAKSGDDLTQATLAQIILESRRAARLLPVPLLVQLIRMGDDALSEFFSSYMSWALDIYLQAKQGAQAIAPFNPFATLPFTGANAFARLLSQAPWADGLRDPRAVFEQLTRAAKTEGAAGAANGASPAEPPSEADETEGAPEDIAELRKEIEALKAALESK